MIWNDDEGMVTGSRLDAQGQPGTCEAKSLGLGGELVVFVGNELERSGVRLFLFDNAVNHNRDLWSQLADQIHSHRVITDGANRLVDHDLAAVDFAPNGLGEFFSDVAIGYRAEEACRCCQRALRTRAFWPLMRSASP